jgi:uncharacterized protein
MKIIFTFLLCLLFSIISRRANAQDSQQDSTEATYIAMNKTQLAKYRKFIWDSIPMAVGWVNDFESLFSFEEENKLQRIIEEFEKKTTVEIMVVTIDTNMVAREDFNNFSYRLLRIWGIGKRLKENGIIICISSGYQMIKVTCDFGIESMMNESTVLHTVGKYFIPSYKRNRYFEGTYKGVSALIAQLNKRIKSMGGEDLVF